MNAHSGRDLKRLHDAPMELGTLCMYNQNSFALLILQFLSVIGVDTNLNKLYKRSRKPFWLYIIRPHGIQVYTTNTQITIMTRKYNTRYNQPSVSELTNKRINISAVD